MGNPNAANVLVGKPKVTGGVYAGAISATLPTDASTALAVGLTGMGYAGDSGLVQTIGTDTTPVVAWGGDTVRVLRTSHDLSYAVTLLEVNAATLGEVFGTDNVTTTEGVTKVTINAKTNGRRAYVFDMVDDANFIRIVVPNGEITGLDDISFVDGEPITFPITITAYPDTSGNKAYLYLEASGS